VANSRAKADRLLAEAKALKGETEPAADDPPRTLEQTVNLVRQLCHGCDLGLASERMSVGGYFEKFVQRAFWSNWSDYLRLPEFRAYRLFFRFDRAVMTGGMETIPPEWADLGLPDVVAYRRFRDDVMERMRRGESVSSHRPGFDADVWKFGDRCGSATTSAGCGSF
jgi:hypothetical protein